MAKQKPPKTGSTSVNATGVVKSRTLAVPSEDDIRLRAYQIYQQRGGQTGSPEADWLRAEWELRQNGHAAAKP